MTEESDISGGITGLLDGVKVRELSAETIRLILDQYRLYVEMADRISARRITTMSFFLPSNTAFVGALAVLLREGTLANAREWALAPFGAAMIMCVAWWLMLLSYKRLNTSKYAVILDMERMLPLAPYAAEWRMLGEGRQRRDYLPITSIELLVPWVFCSIYAALAITLIG
jgi:hypothetical protein